MEIKVSSKGQIVIPRQLREKYEIKQGTTLKITDEEGEIKLVPPIKMTSLCGSWEIDNADFEKEIQEGRSKWR